MDETRELFRALELAHYAERFRERLFVIALPAEAAFSQLVMDFKVLASYRIQVLLVTRDPDFGLQEAISRANKRGSRFQLSLLTELLLSPQDDALLVDFERVRTSLAQGYTPVIAYHGSNFPDSPQAAEPQDVERIFSLAARVALEMEARKLLLVTPVAEALRGALPRSSVQMSELEGLPERLREAGLESALPLCRFVSEQLTRGLPDVVLLEARSGHLFREVFTYDGAGILFTPTRSARVRRGELRDVTDISLLLRPEVEAGNILPVPESHIEANIHNYWVYEIDGMPVGQACIKRHGDDAEMAQFATLPRYRGRGRARELAQFLVDEARRQGCGRVFALSIDPRMWEFFQSLGFEPVEREVLPLEWRRNYDLSRPSRAFLKDL